MAALTSKDRLQPALLDRLTDHAPLDHGESRESRVVSMRQLRRSVLRDLTNLLNATDMYRREDCAVYPLVERSVLNYGLPDFTGRALSSLDPVEVSKVIARTILQFEPRIIGHSLRVSPVPPEGHSHPTAIAFLVEGDLWAQPYPERLYFRTELDLEAGGVTVCDDFAESVR